MKNILAIDPGAKGGIAWHCPGTAAQCLAVPESREEFVNMLRGLICPNRPGVPWICFLEQVGGYIGKEQPGSRMFTFGESYGFAQGVLAAFGVPVRLVRPQTWQRGIPNRIGEYSERKRALKDFAQQVFPGLRVTLATADALCILNYAVRWGHTDSLEDKQTRAIQWCVDLGYAVPAADSKEFKRMFAYWCDLQKSQK